MVDLGEDVYEILSENGWEIIEWGECIGQGWFYNIEYTFDDEETETVEETVNCMNDSKEAFIEGIRDLAYNFDALEHVANWMNDSVEGSCEDLLDDAHEIEDSLNNLRIALEDIDFEDEEEM